MCQTAAGLEVAFLLQLCSLSFQISHDLTFAEDIRKTQTEQVDFIGSTQCRLKGYWSLV